MVRLGDASGGVEIVEVKAPRWWRIDVCAYLGELTPLWVVIRRAGRSLIAQISNSLARIEFMMTRNDNLVRWIAYMPLEPCPEGERS